MKSECDNKYCYEYKLTYNYARYCEGPWDITLCNVTGLRHLLCPHDTNQGKHIV